MTTPAAPAGGQTVVDLTAWPAAKAVNLGPGGTAGLATSLPGFLVGYSVRETSGTAAAVVELHDGTDSSGQVVATIGLAAGASKEVMGGPPGVLCRAGLYATVVTGAAKGVAWWVPVTSG